MCRYLSLRSAFCSFALCHIVFLDHPSTPNVRVIENCETCTSNSSRRNAASSSSCRSLPSNSSFKASSNSEAMLSERPDGAVNGALGLPKARTLDCIALTGDRLLQPATFAIWSAVKRPAYNIVWICSRYASARFGAMLVSVEAQRR